MGMTITGGRIIDPARGLDGVGDLHLDGEVVVDSPRDEEGWETVDAGGLWVVPGLIDAHVHLREPGGEQKETIATGLAAAAAGGFTAVLPMPNTSPPIDTPELTEMLIGRARELGGTRLYPVPAITRGRRGETLAALPALVAAGAVAFSDDGDAVADDDVMEQALALARELEVPLSQHAEDPALSRGGAMHAGEVAERLGASGWPVEAELRVVERDIELAARTGAHIHVQHISAARSVEAVRQGRESGVHVTAEVTPHHLHLTDAAVADLGALAKVNPPLREAADVEACRRGLADGAIDIVASDHAPHTAGDKQGGLEEAMYGLVGLETSVPLLLDLVAEGVVTPARMIAAMSTEPARIFGLPGGVLTPGSLADVTLIDPSCPHVIDPDRFRTKGRNTPFAGREVPGRAVMTVVGGKVVYSDATRTSR